MIQLPQKSICFLTMLITISLHTMLKKAPPIFLGSKKQPLFNYLDQKASNNMQLGVYKHYKGNYYKVIGIAHHTETEELLVMYQSLYGDYAYWVRPFDMFNGSLEYNGAHVKRFTYMPSESFVP